MRYILAVLLLLMPMLVTAQVPCKKPCNSGIFTDDANGQSYSGGNIGIGGNATATSKLKVQNTDADGSTTFGIKSRIDASSATSYYAVDGSIVGTGNATTSGTCTGLYSWVSGCSNNYSAHFNSGDVKVDDDILLSGSIVMQGSGELTIDVTNTSCASPCSKEGLLCVNTTSNTLLICDADNGNWDTAYTYTP